MKLPAVTAPLAPEPEPPPLWTTPPPKPEPALPLLDKRLAAYPDRATWPWVGIPPGTAAATPQREPTGELISVLGQMVRDGDGWRRLAPGEHRNCSHCWIQLTGLTYDTGDTFCLDRAACEERHALMRAARDQRSEEEHPRRLMRKWREMRRTSA